MTFTRRTFLAALPGGVAAPLAPAFSEVYQGDTPLMLHLQHFRDLASAAETAPDYWATHDALTRFAHLASPMPVTSTADLAAKVILANGDGRWMHSLMLGPNRPGQLMAELRALAI